MANALIVRQIRVPQAQLALRAAQYVRMSTDYQEYSIVNQAAAIAAYAQAHDLTIVRTYRDDGESGLQLKNRPGLLKLLQDIGHADFSHILVYDVSRWGRFQDVDESAHYEYLCKKAGIKVSYCAEQFDNDGSLLSSIVKNLKRVMAAEYSRELSVKVHAGACRLASLGFKQGGAVGYGLSRELVDENENPKCSLKKGERKYLHTDHIKLRPGAPDEVATVRWIFNRFLVVRSELKIARELNQRGIPNSKGKRWSRMTIHWMLQNESYIGNLVYNRRSSRLKQKGVNNPELQWVRCNGALTPIIDPDLFARVQQLMKGRWVSLPKDEMLAQLRRTLHKHGRLSVRIINDAPGLPSSHTYREHFGTLRNAYNLIGYNLKRDCDWIDSRRKWASAFDTVASKIASAITKAGGRVDVDSAVDCLAINRSIAVSFRVARSRRRYRADRSPRWAFNRRVKLPPGLVVVFRLADGDHQNVLDYLLFETARIVDNVTRFSDRVWHRYQWQRFETTDALVKAIVRRTTKTSPASPSRSRQPKRVHSKGRSREKSRRVLH
ncbi:recombinase family protein [Bradyrhizobium sp. ORS 86]|uniref:recombinase family protein n=1 Tax=Bradyrhizobium sp. ORS 86 TaxID=1685970 RepID=UPI00388E7C10